MTRRRKRELTEEERLLWRHVVRHVEPLPGKAVPPDPLPARAPETATAAPPRVAPAADAPKRPPGTPPSPRMPTAAPYRPVPAPPPPIPPLTKLARKERAALSRRSRHPDATLDLHGMRQSEAHLALHGFLHRAASQGHTIVLVVTGKGGSPGTGSIFDERGVLRRLVPHWLAEPGVRGLVVGFESAAHHHGGEGALYVRLRRRNGR
ncbi:Smr/MutS family protein [Salinarimonas ramus]|uniref:DNA mismatch repair protein MutS n=1 Tax=Salinarimonas ramus TaxID=690164 RepID=A0A917QJ05_9HYPH|nr:Smr/MutS family protein [Salinarimonas ramus]GGK53562.1 DNA mismatch repair protein MutS [Salinarimonas ramus]